MTPLPIFRLPQLAYIKIINSMDLAEQFLTALCSRKAYALVKKNKSKSINLSLRVDLVSLLDKQTKPAKLLVVCIGLESTWISKKNEKSIDINEKHGLRCVIDNQYYHDLLKVCWKDCSVGLRNMLELVCDLFRVVHIGNADIREPEDIWIVDWLEEQHITLERLNFFNWNQQIPDEGIKNAISKCNTQQLHMFAKPTDGFQIENFPNSFELFSCIYGSWITIDNLIALDCVQLQIFGKDFTTRETNRFLKHWIKGGSSRMKLLEIGIQEYNQDRVFADIQNHLTHVPGKRVYESPYESKFTFNGMQLQRNDGVTASIQYVPEVKFLYFGVWPDANGNA